MNAPVTPPPEFAAIVRELLEDQARSTPAAWASMQLARDAAAQTHDAAATPLTSSLDEALAQLQAQSPLLARTLRLHFAEGEALRAIGQRTHRSPASVHRDIQAGLRQLAAILWQWETQARERFAAGQLQRLEPPSYDRLFGVQTLIGRMTTLLQADQGPRLLLLSGGGGLGKTSLADFLSRELIAKRAFRAFGWVSLRPQVSLWDDRPYFQSPSPQQALEDIFETLARQLLGRDALPAPFSLDQVVALLSRHLHRIPHFIVIDNLETLDGATPLLAEIRRLVGSTRFLITSRVNLPYQPDVYHQPAPPLSADAAVALLRHEGRKRNILALNQASEDDLTRIYARVGGNPLALKLVAGQLHAHDIDAVVADLTGAHSHNIAHLYDYIYSRAWRNLDDLCQRVLLAMPLLPPAGGSVPQLTAMTQLDATAVRQALETLVQQNLVDHHPDATPSRYAIHNLTRTFLQQQARRWL